VLAVDPMYDAIVRDMTSRYCPIDKTAFVGRLGILMAVCAVIALLLFVLARFRSPNESRHSPRRFAAYVAAGAVVVFAFGGAALVIFGLSGCGGETQAGLTWDWPW